MSKIKGKKTAVRMIAGGLAAAIIGAGAYQVLKPEDVAAATYTEETAARRDIQNVLSATATLQPLDTYDVTTLVSGEVTSADFEEGDIVEKGQLLYTVDQSDAQNSIDRAQISLQKSKVSYQEQLDTLADLTVTSKWSGVIIEVNVSEGDSIQNNTTIATLRDSDTMLLEIPFNAYDVQNFSIGNAADVTLDGSFETLQGTVTEIDGADTVLDGYQTVRYVTIAVNNPGALSPSAAATATINGIAANSGANFSYNEERILTAETSGKIESLKIKEGDRISAGQTIAQLSSSSLETQIKNSALSIQESEISLQNTMDTLEDYSITAPISGTIITKNTKAGDSIGSGSGSAGVSTLAVIYDMSALKFDIALDELDISKVAVGQEVEITVDALDGEVFSGQITNISVAGTTTNGATTYPVTVEIADPPESLLPGMNINASIIVAESENTIAVPSAAVQRGNTVYVKGADTTAGTQTADDAESEGAPQNSSRVPEGYHAVQVETGIADDHYIEILSGLSEDEVIYVPQIRVSGSGSGEEQMPMGGGEMPGGGRMPAGGGGGGMPGGAGGMP